MKIKQEQHGDIIKRLSNGEIFRTIAEDYGVSQERIRQIANEKKVYHRGIAVRKENRVKDILNNANKESLDLFLNSGLNIYDLVEECISIYRVKRFCILKTSQPFNVEFTGINWNRHCPLTGQEIDYFADRTAMEVASITLINPNGGYVNGNVHTVLRFRKSS